MISKKLAPQLECSLTCVSTFDLSTFNRRQLQDLESDELLLTVWCLERENMLSYGWTATWYDKELSTHYRLCQTYASLIETIKKGVRYD